MISEYLSSKVAQNSFFSLTMLADETPPVLSNVYILQKVAETHQRGTPNPRNQVPRLAVLDHDQTQQVLLNEAAPICREDAQEPTLTSFVKT